MEFALSFNGLLGGFMTLFLAGPRRCRVTVSPDQLQVRMGLGGWAFATDLPRSSIAKVAPYRGRAWAWGAHGFRGRWLVNGSSQGLVQITVKPVGRARCLGFPIRLRELTLSLDDPDGFVSALTPA